MRKMATKICASFMIMVTLAVLGVISRGGAFSERVRQLVASYNSLSLLPAALPSSPTTKATAIPINQVASRYQDGERLRKVFLDTVDTAAIAKLKSTHQVIKEVNYGSFQMFIVREADSTEKTAQDAAVHAAEAERQVQDRLTLNGLVIDTTAPETAQERIPQTLRQYRMARALHGRARPEGGLFIVQFIGPVKDEWHDELKRTGSRVVDYLGKETYVVKANPAAAEKLMGMLRYQDYVQYLGDYAPAYRLRPGLRNKIQAVEGAAFSSSVENLAKTADEPLNVLVQVIDGEDAQETIEFLKNRSLTPVSIDRRSNYHLVTMSVRPSGITEIAKQEAVFAVEETAHAVKFDAGQTQIITNGFKDNGVGARDYQEWLSKKGFPSAIGAGNIIVNIVDDCPTLGGLNADSNIENRLAPYRKDIPSNTLHSDLKRESIAFELNPAQHDIKQSGHGFMNAHIIVGNGSFTSTWNNYNIGLGIAPFIKVGVTAIFNNLDEVYLSSTRWGEWEKTAFDKGVRVSSNSWGTTLDSYNDKYDHPSANYDALAFTYGKNVDRSRAMTFVFAAGNFADADQDGIGEGSTITSPGIAKNVITVGASGNTRPFTTLCEGSTHNDTNGDMAYFSGRGHSRSTSNCICLEKPQGGCSGQFEQTKITRFKPDLVAPGTRIQAAVPPGDLYLDNLFGCEKYFPANQTFYSWVSGTSHAAPAVSGAAALLLHKYNKLSPSMIKAWLMNSATLLKGDGTTDRCTRRKDLTTNTQGMGRLDLERAFDNIPRIGRDEDYVLSQGETYTLRGKVVKQGTPLRVTLVWTDPPASTNNNRDFLVNDLDLKLSIDAQTIAGKKVSPQRYVGNFFDGDISIDPDTTKYAGSIRDGENNVESIYVDTKTLPTGTAFTITVRAQSLGIGKDGVNNKENGPRRQDFALLVYNATKVSESRNIVGSFDGINNTTISGWAADLNTLNWTATIDIYDGATQIASVPANSVRPDVSTHLFGLRCEGALGFTDASCPNAGNHGFALATPTRLKDKKTHTVSIKVGDVVIGSKTYKSS